MENETVVLSVIPEGYVAKPEAIQLSNRSLKGFEQTVAAQQIETLYVTNPGKRPLPIYKRTDIERIVKAEPTTTSQELVVAGTKALVRKPRRVTPIEMPAQTGVSIDRMHLITQGQAHRLGYPISILREWRDSPTPPGIAYGKSGFRYSVPALAERMKQEIGLE